MTFASMLKLATTVVGARLLGAGLGLLTQLVLARQFGTADVGAIFLTISAIGLLSLFVSTGYPALILSKGPQLIARNNTRALAAHHGAFLRDTVALWLLTCAVSWAVARAGLVTPGIASALLFACLAALPASLLRYNSAIANSLRRFNLSYMPDFIIRPAAFLVFLVLANALGRALDVAQVLWIFVILLTIVACLQSILLGSDGVVMTQWTAATSRHTKRLRPRAWALLIVAAVATAYSDLVTLVAGLFLNAHDVALAGVAIRLAAIAAFVIQAAQQVLLPDLAQSLHTQSRDTTRAMLIRMNIISLGTMLCAIAGAAILGRHVLAVFGADYTQAYGVLLLFLCAQAVRALGGMNQQLLSLRGKQLQTATACLTAIAILIIASFILCPRNGLTGLGYAVLLTECAWFTHLAWLTQRLTGSRADLPGLLR